MEDFSDIKFYSCTGSSSCFKVELLLIELGLSFTKIEVDLWKKENLTATFQSISPLCLVPAIEFGEGYFRLSESNAILRYLASRFERYDLYPLSLEYRARIDQMLDLISFSLNQDLGALIWQNHWVPKISGARDLIKIEKLKLQLLPVLEKVDGWLSQSNYLCGSVMSLADIGMYSHVVVFDRSGLNLENWPHIQTWSYRMQNNPRWKKRVEDESFNFE